MQAQQFANRSEDELAARPLLEECVTFQIVLVGRDGLVVGSDRRMVHASFPIGDNPAYYPTLGDKFVPGHHEDAAVICFFSGGVTSANAARTIAADCKPVKSEFDWETSLIRAIESTPVPPGIPIDQVFVIRRDIPDAFWLVARGNQAVPLCKITDHLCIGSNSPARFLPRHIWSSDYSVAELAVLAKLTLGYAAEENPEGVGGGADIMTLDKQMNVQWSTYAPNELKIITDEFTGNLGNSFSKLCAH